MHRVIDLGKPYLLQTLSPHNYLLTDAQSISYISRVKYFDNFLMEISIPSLHVVHTPGRCLSLPDMMSRQLNNVLMDQGSNLSKEHAYIIPSLREILKPAQLIKHKHLYTLLNCSVPAEYFDIHPKQYMYTQKIV